MSVQQQRCFPAAGYSIITRPVQRVVAGPLLTMEPQLTLLHKPTEKPRGLTSFKPAQLHHIATPDTPMMPHEIQDKLLDLKTAEAGNSGVSDLILSTHISLGR